VSKLESYRKVQGPFPRENLAWQVFGAGFENLGKDGRPTPLELRDPKDNEILLRIDALGLCLSDIKIINQGSAHPRLRGRDLSVDPTVLGHECSVTVVKVGAQWKDTFRVGDRYVVQADIYVSGVGYAFGYLIPGGMQQYCHLDERALAGDEGCYLIPVRPETGYSEAALAEPWACVEMSYSIEDRLSPGDGELLIVTDEDPVNWRETNPFAIIVPRTLEGLADERFDDVIVCAPAPEIVNVLVPRLRKNGVMFLLGAPAEEGPVSIDIGRIHYDNLRFYGGIENMAAAAEVNKRSDLLEGGAALFIGAGGPMGQMHVQRALEIENAPKRVVVTDLDRSRLDHIQERFARLAQKKAIDLRTFAPSEFTSQSAMDAAVKALAPQGYDDVVVLAPVAALVSSAMAFAADNAFVNVFAGLGIGSMADIPLEDLCRGVKIAGSSGSRIRDLRKVLGMVEAKQLNTNMSVAAIGGLAAGREGLEGVKSARFPGKTVIYTQIPDLPLMALEEIPKRIPELRDKLGPQGEWTKEAEEGLLEMYL
jgi:threonine dehydrogenase-like Zn-dependent dehydrogenase